MRIKNAFCFALVAFLCFVSQVSADCGGAQAAASCSGSQSVLRRTPVRTFIASRPVVSTIQKIKANAQSNRAARMASCSGEPAAASCSGSQIAPQTAAPCPTESAPSTEVVSAVSRSQPKLVSAVSSTYQQALASAQYRAANRIHGHSYLDTHRTSGVGWATSNPKPNTCLGGDNGSTYAVVLGSDGWYATKFR